MHLQQTISIFWFRRDLRLPDNNGLAKALQGAYPVLPVFIFETSIPEKPENRQDARFTFLYDELRMLRQQISHRGSSLLVNHGNPLDIYKQFSNEFTIKAVYIRQDYEPFAKKRDSEIQQYLQAKGIHLHSFKDQLIFEGSEILSGSGTPYKIFTPYCNAWQQAHKFDRGYHYIQQWVPEFGSEDYPEPMVDLKESRAKATAHYKKQLNA